MSERLFSRVNYVFNDNRKKMNQSISIIFVTFFWQTAIFGTQNLSIQFLIVLMFQNTEVEIIFSPSSKKVE